MIHTSNPSNSIQERVNSRIIAVKERDDQRVTNVARYLSLGALFFLIIIGSKSHVSGHHFHGNMLYLFALVTLINLINYHLRQNTRFYQNSFISLVGVLFLYLTASGGESNTGPLWFYVFPPLGFYILGIKYGLITSVSAICVVLLMFFFPELPFVTTEYNPDFQIRFIATLSFVTICAYILDDSRRTAKNELLEMATLAYTLPFSNAILSFSFAW